jgi:hypothetical protein
MFVADDRAEGVAAALGDGRLRVHRESSRSLGGGSTN